MAESTQHLPPAPGPLRTFTNPLDALRIEDREPSAPVRWLSALVAAGALLLIGAYVLGNIGGPL